MNTLRVEDFADPYEQAAYRWLRHLLGAGFSRVTVEDMAANFEAVSASLSARRVRDAV